MVCIQLYTVVTNVFCVCSDVFLCLPLPSHGSILIMCFHNVSRLIVFLPKIHWYIFMIPIRVYAMFFNAVFNWITYYMYRRYSELKYIFSEFHFNWIFCTFPHQLWLKWGALDLNTVGIALKYIFLYQQQRHTSKGFILGFEHFSRTSVFKIEIHFYISHIKRVSYSDSGF